jgi:8-oxo-dGTP diphosphatase/2-hydroxy-dATP diphosphatase
MEKKIMTLVLVRQGNKILLGMKKRGFGQGRWNGFGGKLAEGETIEQAAKRELFEEAGINASDLEKFGVVDFYWNNKTDSYFEVNIFKSQIFNGTPAESEEMKPRWFDVKEIPYNKMWQDDIHWMPLFLENKKFKGKFVFDDKDNILEKELTEIKEI